MEESEEVLLKSNTLNNQQTNGIFGRFYLKWIFFKIAENNNEEDKDADYQQQPEMKVIVKSVSFKIAGTGTPLLARPTSGHISQMGRPIPTEKKVEDPVSFAF